MRSAHKPFSSGRKGGRRGGVASNGLSPFRTFSHTRKARCIPASSAIVQLPSTDVIDCHRLLRAQTPPQAKSVRAHILLRAHAHAEWSSQALALSLGVSDRLVRTWRRRWEATRSLNDWPRAGAPRQFEASGRALVTALAWGLPRRSGVPLAHWSRADLARHLARTASLPPLSASPSGRWLKAQQLRPWRSHSGQPMQHPETFLLRAGPVLHLDEQAQSLVQEGTRVVCTDENTGIQAREAEQAPRRVIKKHPI